MPYSSHRAVKLTLVSVSSYLRVYPGRTESLALISSRASWMAGTPPALTHPPLNDCITATYSERVPSRAVGGYVWRMSTCLSSKLCAVVRPGRSRLPKSKSTIPIVMIALHSATGLISQRAQNLRYSCTQNLECPVKKRVVLSTARVTYA